MRELLRLLKRNHLYTHTDVIFIQGLLKNVERQDLYNRCIQYARKQEALYFYEKPTGALLHKLWHIFMRN
jgi:hypothetical protein